MATSERRIESVPLAALRPSERNPRKHGRAQVRKIARSISRFGFNSPIIVDSENRILVGHGRCEAAQHLGLKEAPCVRIENLTEAEKRAYMIADNALSDQSHFAKEDLAFHLIELGALDIDIAETALEPGEVDLVISEVQAADPKGEDPNDDDDPPPASPAVGVPVTQPGDLWVLGRHRLLCGDAKDRSNLDRLMDGATADALFTDPPFNVPVDGHVCGNGQLKHREFHEASGEMSPAAFIDFLTTTLGNAASVCRDGAIAFVCMDWRHLQEVLAAGYATFTELKNLCVWKKSNAGMGTFYRSQHELFLVWKVGTAAHTNTFGLGDKGRYRTNVWSYAGANAFSASRLEDLKSHPTVKPVPLIADAIRDVTHRGEVVLDIFGGSGSTLIAAQKTGRCARILEIDPAYCDVIVRRWEKLTGKYAILEGDGRTFEDVADFRAGWNGGQWQGARSQ